MQMSDGGLVAEAISGNDRAFDELVSRYRSRVYYLALSKVGNEETARDLAQEAFVQAYMSLPALREQGKFGGWIAAIAGNLSINYLRKPRELLMPTEAVIDMHHSGSPTIPANGDASTAREILYNLPDGARSAAVLYFLEEMKMTEIAEFLSIPLSAVKSRIRTARSHIRKEMVDMVKQTAKKHEPGVEFNHSLKHRLELARWYRELGELFDIGVSLRTALARLAEGDYSDSIKDATAKLAAAVEAGSGLSGALEDIPELVAADTIPMMRAGEIGGILAWSVRTLADRIEAEEAKQKIELSFWCRILRGMLDAGVLPYDAFSAAAEASRSKSLSQASRELAAIFERDARREGDYNPFDRSAPPPVFEGQAIKDILDKHSDVFPPLLRVAIATGPILLSAKLEWVGARIAAEICRHVTGTEVEVPAPHSDVLKMESIQHIWGLQAVELLKDRDPGVRAAAAEMLGRFGATAAAKDLLVLLEDANPRVIKAAIQALLDLGAAPPTELLLTRLNAPDQSVRRASVQALRELDRVHEASKQLAQLLADPDERVAQAAVSVLEDAGEIEVLGNQALELVRHNANSELRGRAATVLNKHLFPVQEEVLVPALSDQLAEVRFMAARILGHRRDARAVPAIREAVEAGKLSQDYLFLADDLEKG